MGPCLRRGTATGLAMYNLLSGLSVIEASSFVASPTAGLYCAQFGAEVIRVDQIGGGPDFRRWPVTAENNSLYWENLNRAKKSVALDLSRPEGRELLQQLVRATGQFITNFPAGGFLSHDTLAEGRADLITVRVMGWADGSPALDYTVNNSVGYPMLTGTGPEPVNHVLPAWDLLTGAYAAFALLAAIQRRSVSGEGGEVRIPLSDVAIGTVANLGGVAEVLYSGENRPRLGNAVYGLFGRDFVTRDGKRTMIVVVTPRQWANLIAALNLGDAIASIESERRISFAKDDGLRFDHRDVLYPLFEKAIASRDHADLAAAFDAGGIVQPCPAQRPAQRRSTDLAPFALLGRNCPSDRCRYRRCRLNCPTSPSCAPAKAGAHHPILAMPASGC